MLLVPDSAVLRSGEKNTVFVALEQGKFEPRVVNLGPRAENNMYQALAGLKEGEPVVTSAQFMLDSESQLREAVQKMLEPAQGRLRRSRTRFDSPGIGRNAGADGSGRSHQLDLPHA